MSLGLYRAVKEARESVECGYGLESAVRLAAAEYQQNVARVALLTADALIGQAQALLTLELHRKRTSEVSGIVKERHED